MVRIASATLDFAETLTTRRPLAASTSFSFMADLPRYCGFPNLTAAPDLKVA
jgi:hypothetical protein